MEERKKELLPIVGIGASAGGLNALKNFFSGIPDNTGVAYVIVMHLSPEHKSVLAELLQPHVKMPVRQVAQSTELKSNHVYVIPPNANLNTIDTHLRLSKLEEKRSERAPIDHFFRTLAKTHNGSAIGIILTGTGSDGTLGMKEIKEKGGLTIVHDPQDAEFDGMPQSVISTGLVDLILPLNQIPKYLLKYINTNPRLKILETGYEHNDEEYQIIQKIFAQIRARTRRDFSRYKISTLLRRLQRRMQIYQIENLTDYLDLLRKNPEEVISLSDDFLINVTTFFRDKEVYDYLGDKVLPRIIESKKPDEQVRIWSVGCATGEEAYSLAILFSDITDMMDNPPSVQIFASDLHEHSLAKAREGFFPGDIKTDVSEERLKKYFKREDGGYRIRKELREMVIFTPHNLLGDPPFSRLDMVVCRNLLIYLKRDIQRDVFELLHYALLPAGCLVLGTSENLESTDLFKTENKELSIYCKKNVAGPEPRLPVFPTVRSHIKEERPLMDASETISYGGLHHKLVERYGPPSILISPDYQVLHVSENAGRYLEIMGGELSKDVFKLIRKELMLDLRSVIYASKEQDKMVRSQAVAMQINGKKRRVFISSRLIADKDREDVILLLFEEYAEQNEPEVSKKTKEKNHQRDHQIQHLESELRETRQRLQAIIEEYETSREEMKASNEELQSANEELRSTLEELETSKEELQSMNEELTTLNQENRHKVEELSRLSDDLQNLMAATDIATLFLNKDLRILRYTPKLGELFNVRPADVGRPISDITNKMGYNTLADDAIRVLKNLQPSEKEVVDQEGQTFFARILPYRSAEDKIDGVVITFFDISAIKNTEERLRKSEERYRTLFESIEVGFCIIDVIFEDDEPVDYRFLETNPAFNKLSGLKETREKRVRELDPDHEAHWFKSFGQVAKTGRAERFESQVRLLDNRWFFVYAIKIKSGGKNSVAVLYTDITERKQSEEALISAKTEAEQAARAKEEFLAHMSHEIRTPLNAVVGISHLLIKHNHLKDQEENLNTLKIAGENLSRLINDILDISKVKAGQVSIDSEEVVFTEFLKRVIDIHQPIAKKQNLELKCIIDSSIPEHILCDQLKLSQVLHNLLSNAIKFTHKGQVKLTIDLEKRKKDDVWIKFEVHDTGIGIAKDKLDSVFDVFKQADSSTVRNYGGTGLGLTITRMYLEMMNSRIHVESTPGKGTVFSFVLKVKGTDGSSLNQRKKVQVHTSLDDLSVLVVEDDTFNRLVVSQLLQMWNINYHEAVNGEEALEKAKANQYGMILMDVRMPVMDGYESSAKIRKLDGYAGVPIIALTADLSQQVKDETKNGLFNDIVIKPVDPDKLIGTIRDIVNQNPVKK